MNGEQAFLVGLLFVVLGTFTFFMLIDEGVRGFLRILAWVVLLIFVVVPVMRLYLVFLAF